MRKIAVSTLVFIVAFSMLSEGLMAGTYSKSYYLESGTYGNNWNKQWSIRESGATRIRVHFVWIRTESGYDYVRTSTGDSWSGRYSNVWSNWSYGDTITITLTSDYSVTDEGFKIDKIEYEYTAVTPPPSNSTIPDNGSTIPGSGQTYTKYYRLESGTYGNNWNKQWSIRESGATRIRVHFVWIRTESGYDYVRTSTGDSWSGSYSNVWSNWSYGDTITITLTSDYSVTREGFKIDKIEYQR